MTPRIILIAWFMPMMTKHETILHAGCVSVLCLSGFCHPRQCVHRFICLVILSVGLASGLSIGDTCQFLRQLGSSRHRLRLATAVRTPWISAEHRPTYRPLFFSADAWSPTPEPRRVNRLGRCRSGPSVTGVVIRESTEAAIWPCFSQQ